MAKSVLDIVIRTIKEGGADKETVQGLVSLKRSILDAAAVGGMLVTAGYAIKKALDETVGSLVAYADQVRTVQNATGASAEDASKLIQILDDQKVGFEQLEKAIAKSGKAYDFSITGIANMSEAYLKLGTDQERAAFMQQRFGKQWIDFVPVMQQGSKAILDAADAVDKSLILNQKAVDMARQYEIAQDNVNDSITGFKYTLGQEALPAVVQFTDGLNVMIRAQQIQLETHVSAKKAFAQATEEIAAQKAALLQHADQVKLETAAQEESAQAAREAAAAFKEESAARQSMLGLITSIASETRNYNDKQAELTQKMAENRAEAEALYPWQSQQLDELNQKYADMSAAYDANAAAHNAAMGKIQYDLLVTKLSADGLTDAEYQIAQQAGLMFGIFDQNSINTANNMNQIAQAVLDGKLKVDDLGAAISNLPSNKNIDVVMNIITHGFATYGNGASYATSDLQYQQGNSGYAAGGISTGPQSGHMELLHGTEAVIPLQNGSIPVQMQGAPAMSGGDTNINVQLTIASPMTILDQQTAQNTLLPFIINGLREARARGAV